MQKMEEVRGEDKWIVVNSEQQAMRRGNVHDYCGWSQGYVMNSRRSFYPGLVINQPKKKIITISTR